MSENIEKAVQTEESSETKGTEATAPAATDNVVLYPVSDEEKTVSAAQETSDTESKATDGKTADNTNKFSDTQNTKRAGGHEGLAGAADVLHVGGHTVGRNIALLLQLYFFGEDCVEDGVTDLISDLIGMTFGHRLRRKNKGPVLGWDGTKFF